MRRERRPSYTRLGRPLAGEAEMRLSDVLTNVIIKAGRKKGDWRKPCRSGCCGNSRCRFIDLTGLAVTVGAGKGDTLRAVNHFE